MKTKTVKPYAVVRLWATAGRVQHKTYRWYAKAEDACATVNRLNAGCTVPGTVYVLLDAVNNARYE